MEKNPKIIESVLNKTGRYIDTNKLIPDGAKIVIALSGGVDSAALLDILCELANKMQYKLSAAHLNHCIRNEADSDQRFCEELCRNYGIEFHGKKIDIPASAKEKGLSVETAAREIRYDFLKNVCLQTNSHYLVTAHHSNDNVETFLHHLFRGTHLKGAGGIAPSRKLTGTEINLVRPLLSCEKQELVEYCQQKGLSWREDCTNFNSDYTRNFIRRELLPLITERINSKTNQAIERFVNSVRMADEYIESQACQALQNVLVKQTEKTIVFDCKAFIDTPTIIGHYLCKTALKKLGLAMKNVGFDDITAIAELAQRSHNHTVNLPCDARAYHDHGNIVIELAANEIFFDSIELNLNGSTKIGDIDLSCEIHKFNEQLKTDFEKRKKQGSTGPQWVDADKIKDKLFARPRIEGEKFTPLGQSGTKTVSDFLADLKIPRHLRNEIPCICDVEGIISIGNLRTEDRVKITKQTQRVLIIKMVHSKVNNVLQE